MNCFNLVRRTVLVVLLSAVTVLFQGCSSKLVDSEGTATLAEFEKITTGMNYEKACDIIGGKGVEITRVAGTPDFPETVVYAWNGSGRIGASMNAMFQGNRLIGKSQAGLK